MRDSLHIHEAFPASILDYVGDGDLSLGIDLGTTEGKKSNPTAFALTEADGLMRHCRLAARFKTGQRDVIQGVLERLLTLLEARNRRLKIAVLDGTNERLTAVDIQQEVASRVQVRIAVLGSTRLVFGEKVTLKTYVFGLVASHLEDGRLTLPAEEWIKKDVRQVIREKGGFTSAVAEDGAHADLYCALGLSLDGHDQDGPIEAQAVSLTGGNSDRDDNDEDEPSPAKWLLGLLGF